MMTYIKLLFVFSVVYGVSPEGVGDRCTQNGLSGVCKLWSECTSADEEYLNEPRMLSPCEANGVESVVCCVETSAASAKPAVTRRDPLSPEPHGSTKSTTESIPAEDPIESRCEPLPTDRTPKKTGRKAWDKCIEYQQKLVFPCERSVAMTFDYDRVDNCRHSADPTIIGGMEASIDEFPHMVQLGFAISKDSLETAVWDCGGTLLSDWFILTAGHCKSKPSSAQTQSYYNVTFAAIGSLQSRKRKVFDVDDCQIYTIDKAIKHPDYHAPNKYHDIALLKTTTRMILSFSAVPACLDVFGGDRDTVVATGWGLADTNEHPEMLQKVFLVQYSEEICRQKIPPSRNMIQGVNVTTQLCYGNDSHAQSVCDTCGGDSGGPIVIGNPVVDCMYSVIGITSVGLRACAVAGMPGIYTKVAYYVPWIESVVWPDNPAEAIH